MRGESPTFDIQVTEKHEDVGRQVKWRVRGQLRSVDDIKELIKEARDASSQEGSDDD